MRLRAFLKSSLLLFVLLGIFIVTDSSYNLSTSILANDELADFQVIAENKQLCLYFNYQNGEFALQNKADQTIWYSNPPEKEEDRFARGLPKMNMFSQLLVDYTDDTERTYFINSYVGSVRREGMVVEEIPNGVKVVFTFEREGFKIPVKYTLGSDYLGVEILTAEIEETGENRITTITLLPFLGAGGSEESGYLLVPDGSGALIYFNNGKGRYQQYREPIYGFDRALSRTYLKDFKEKIGLPVFGIKKDSQALLGIVTRGEALGTINAEVSFWRTSYNNVYCSFLYRQSDSIVLMERDFNAEDVKITVKNPSPLPVIEVRYYPLKKEESNYSGMASRYQRYLVEEKGLTRQITKEDIPFTMALYGGIKKQKSVLGIPVLTVEPLTTYQEVKEIISELKNQGIKEIVLNFRGWMAGGDLNEEIPTVIKLEGNLGGRKDFLELLRFIKENKVEFFPGVDFINFRESGNGIWRFFDSAKAISKAPAIQYEYKLSTYLKNEKVRPWYLLSPEKFPTVHRSFIESYAEYNIGGLALNSLGDEIYSDFSNQGLERGAGQITWENSLKNFRDNIGQLLVDNPNAYALPYIGQIIELPVESSDFDITDESIPFYQLVIHGFIPYSTRPLNLSSDPTYLLLKAIETGSNPLYVWIAGSSTLVKETRYDYLYSANYQDWLNTAISNYYFISKILKKVAPCRMTGHRKLGEGIYETSYENGVSITVDYNKEEIKVKEQGTEFSFLIPGGDPE